MCVALLIGWVEILIRWVEILIRWVDILIDTWLGVRSAGIWQTKKSIQISIGLYPNFYFSFWLHILRTYTFRTPTIVSSSSTDSSSLHLSCLTYNCSRTAFFIYVHHHKHWFYILLNIGTEHFNKHSRLHLLLTIPYSPRIEFSTLSYSCFVLKYINSLSTHIIYHDVYESTRLSDHMKLIKLTLRSFMCYSELTVLIVSHMLSNTSVDWTCSFSPQLFYTLPPLLLSVLL